MRITSYFPKTGVWENKKSRKPISLSFQLFIFAVAAAISNDFFQSFKTTSLIRLQQPAVRLFDPKLQNYSRIYTPLTVLLIIMRTTFVAVSGFALSSAATSSP